MFPYEKTEVIHNPHRVYIVEKMVCFHSVKHHEHSHENRRKLIFFIRNIG